MQELGRNTAALYNFLGQKMPPLNFDDEAVDASCLMAVTLYNRVAAAASTCLSKPECFNNSADARAQLEKTKKHCAEESAIFRQKVFEFREMLQNAKKKPKGMTWYDALHYQRAEILNINNMDGVQMEKEGANASEGYKLTVKKDQKTFHFRKADRVPPKNDTEVVRSFFQSLDAEAGFKKKVLKPIFDGLYNDASQNDYYGMPYLHLFLNASAKNLSGEEILQHLIETQSGAAKTINALKSKDKKKVGDYLKNFTKYVSQREMSSSAEIGFGRKLSDRNVATSRMAELLGLQNMICDSRTAYVRDKNSFIQGNLMEDTKGKESKDLIKEAEEKGREIGYSEEVISQLFSLQIFDVICGQHDRHHGNFHFTSKTKDGKMLLTGIRGLDNDMCFGNLKEIPKTISRNQMRPVTQLNLRGLPISLVNTIMNLDKETVGFIQGDILEKDEQEALWARIQAVQEEIKKLPGLVRDEKTGRYDYTAKEDQDDRLRQLKALKETLENSQKKGKGVEFTSVFRSEIVNIEKLDAMIQKREKELQGTGS